MSVCHSAIVCEYQSEVEAVGVPLPTLPLSHLSPAVENPYRVDSMVIRNQAKLLQKYLRDEQKELQALYALQALVVKLDQPPSEYRGCGWVKERVANMSPAQQGGR